MRLLLDTHVVLWMALAPDRLRSDLRERVEDIATELVFSAVSAWETGIKHKIGRLVLPAPPAEWVARTIRMASLTELDITRAHGLRAAELPLHHRDPFDRLLVAQAQLEGLPLVTADARLANYDVEIVPA